MMAATPPPPPPSVIRSASSSMSRRNYGVFLSFRGPDCRSTFVSHLYKALCQDGLNVFKDDEELEEGQRRSELFEAIEGSRIAIVMFSENYARSRWCLDELKKIMDCHDQGKLHVLPIFYRVSPGEVRLHEKPNGDKGCYQAAIEEMEARYEKNPEMVEGWRKALWRGGDMIGIPLSLGQDEGSVVQEVVRKVSKKLDRLPLEVAKYPVGIDRKLEAVRPLLHLDPHESNVYMIGIIGEGGMGKTTIAKAICNDNADRFDDWCFLSNVRESSRNVKGLPLLQQELLRKLLSNEKLTVDSVDAGIPMIKGRLCNKRVLIILDDVDELEQLDALAGSRSWFGKGSRIIITTRDIHVLPSDRVQHVHREGLLDEAEADSLFRLHAFGESQDNKMISKELIDRFVGYASQLPLALVVLGAFLRDRIPSVWEGKLKELMESPDSRINSVLRISFNGLEDRHREIFLDVACFFNGWSIYKVEKILYSCSSVTSLGIEILKERCLVSVDGGTIHMHDLIVVMGKSIVRDSYPPSRIWQYEDFLDIISKNTVETKVSSFAIDMLPYSWLETWENFGQVKEKLAVKGIVLNLAEKKLIPVQPNTLLGFKNLRFFIALNVDGPRKPLRMPSELRWLEWPGYYAPAIEFDPSSNQIVSLDMNKSWITKIKGKGFKELKYVNLLSCSSLSALPDLSKSSKLEELNIGGCTSLTTLDEAVGSCENLVHLYAGDCSRLAKIPRMLRSKRLQTLALWGCEKLNGLPRFMEHAFLKELHLSGSGLIALPESISNLVALETLYMSGCEQLSIIPSSIYKLQYLRELCFIKCLKLERFPRRLAGLAADIPGLPNLVTLIFSDCRLKDLEFLTDLACFQTLEKLDLSANVFARIPGCLKKFENLKILLLRDCKSLLEVPELPSNSVYYVATPRCYDLRSFPRLHMFICRFPRSYEVDLSECPLGSNFIIASLPIEKVREFTGEASVICPQNEFPQWVTFQSTECGSRYQVSLPVSMSADDILGMAVFVTVESGCVPFDDLLRGYLVYPFADVVVGSQKIRINLSSWEAVHTWFGYITRVPIQGNDSREKPNQQNIITLEFPGQEEVKFLEWGVRMLCKREQDDLLMKVSKIV